MKTPFALVLLASVLSAVSAHAQAVSCPSNRPVVDIRSNDQREMLLAAMRNSNQIIRIGPTVDMEFSSVPVPIHLGHCVTITSVADFDDSNAPESPPSQSLHTNKAVHASTSVVASNTGILKQTGGQGLGPPRPLLPRPSARTPNSPGPALHYGMHPGLTGTDAFIEATCGGGYDANGARISGFRVLGPSRDNQATGEKGISVRNCTDVEISNMEVAGWGGAAIQVDHPSLGSGIPDKVPDQIHVLIHDNYIHNNQHSTDGGHASGYGVNTATQGWSRIYDNVFDYNRHSVAADGTAGGYFADHNLILKGGGYHGAWYETWIHVFDFHGTENCDTFGLTSSRLNCGDAGRTFSILSNTFQFTKTHDIRIRGKPKSASTIDWNVFPFSDKDGAILLFSNDNVTIGSGNRYNADTYGKYDVCDFDGDGIDDLFLATGQTWWFSGAGRFPWTFLRADTSDRKDLRFGYFDGDRKCDALSERPAGSGQWSISSAGTSFWKPLGSFGHPLSEVRFGRFDPAAIDRRPGATRQTTHAFWRSPQGQWFVTPLSHPAWKLIGGSSFPLGQLRFGDFTGDGVTDVLAVENGHWAISESGTKPWRQLNAKLSDPVQNLFVANMDSDDNIDDILRADEKATVVRRGAVAYTQIQVTWWRSRNGVEPWKEWTTYTMLYDAKSPDNAQAGFGFVGRFAPDAAGATLTTDQARTGHFHGAGDRATGANWTNSFSY